MDYGPIVKAILFAIFGTLTAAVTVVTGPTYDNLFVHEMDPTNAFAVWQGGNVFAQASLFSNTLLVELVDPLAVLVILAVGFLYLARAVHPSPRLAGLAPKLIVGILLANLVLPITSALWQLAAGIYPLFYDYGGGAWRTYANLVGPGAINLSWDNGVLAFIVSWVLFSMVLLLSFLIAFRGALVAVLLVLLPVLTLLWPIPGASSVARKAWVLFAEMAVLPCFVVVPLVLAVGSTSVLLTLGLFAAAIAMPQLLSVSGSAISHAGFPNASFAVGSGLIEGAGSSQGTASGLLARSSSSFRQAAARPEDPASSQGGETSASSAHSSRTPRRSASTPRGSGSTFGSGGRGALAGPAGLVLWGMQEGLGRLGRELGARVAKARGDTTGTSRNGDHGPEPSRPTPAVTKVPHLVPSFQQQLGDRARSSPRRASRA
ncbi:MAG: hypothetical protein KGJ23_02765 [Euryarchaeota archaeon]|nr:hypothetical protein [Euryarchaeota archaeon]MDE1835520.1 hypothetical protein [Euryarchaeota archaeon]MDE1879611.1 hypothetical protein [Euryarchaeota archaeon]MDE2043858.1 hypothetical protein [Thermoplasmata archaeon]